MAANDVKKGQKISFHLNLICNKPGGVLFILLGRLQEIILEPIELVALWAGEVEENANKTNENARQRRINEDLGERNLVAFFQRVHHRVSLLELR